MSDDKQQFQGLGKQISLSVSRALLLSPSKQEFSPLCGVAGPSSGTFHLGSVSCEASNCMREALQKYEAKENTTQCEVSEPAGRNECSVNSDRAQLGHSSPCCGGDLQQLWPCRGDGRGWASPIMPPPPRLPVSLAPTSPASLTGPPTPALLCSPTVCESDSRMLTEVRFSDCPDFGKSGNLSGTNS